MRRAIVQDGVLLAAFTLFTAVVLVGDSSRWIALTGTVLVVLQASRLLKRITQLRRRS